MLLQTHALRVTVADVIVCDGLDLSIQPGECWGILGRNGVGKTTLLHTLAGLRAPQQGQIEIQHTLLTQLSRRQLARHIGVMFQDYEDAFPATVLETALIGRHPFIHHWFWQNPSDPDLARTALARVDLKGFESRLINTLSGGERRRLALATLLTQDPDIYLLDEPGNHLDLHYQVRLLELIMNNVNSGHKAAMIIMHDVNMASRFCNTALLLFGNGEAVYGPCKDVFTETNLQRLYNHPISRVRYEKGELFVPG